MSEEFPKVYDFAETEKATTKRWLEAGMFKALPDDRENRYVIMMPLPNVTGALHMGHAMDNVMQDLLIRWHRMLGDNTLWQPGTDHAGIATQAVVEKRLIELENKTRHDVGREGLVERIWQWTNKCQTRIMTQQQRMGCSCDWDRRRFTMDEVCRRAVRECFFRLFKDKLIFRGHRLVNWDCFLQTAVSDDEIVTENVQGHFWHLKYPVIDPADGEPEFVVVATTRPETMLGDTAVACHPDPAAELDRLIAAAEDRLRKSSEKDREEAQAELARLKRRKNDELPLLLRLTEMARNGRKLMLPLQERPIPLICDEWAKPDMGSGCVKVTPGHDPNDYDVWCRHKDEIDIINILNGDGTLNDNAGVYKGLTISGARKKVLQDLESDGLVLRVEDREIPIGHSDRSKTPIEPWLSRQWFVKMGDVEGGVVMGRGTDKEFVTPGLAQAAIDAVEGDWKTATGRKLTFHPDPDRYANGYLTWLKEKRDWCISRQLWWGHRIPIWMTTLEKEQLLCFLDELPVDDDNLFVWIDAGDDRILDRESARGTDEAGPFEVQLSLRDKNAEKKLADFLEKWEMRQDPDVLDTWFSSALWPFSTLGWPDAATAKVDQGQTPLGPAEGRDDSLSYYYPGSCLVTARDIITLWVARMIIMGLYNLGDIPFTDAFIHANIQDGKGERMSKSKGNGIDPVDIIKRYGADALRYVLADMQSGTQDIRLPVQAESPFTNELIDLAKARHGRSIFTYICPHSGKEFDVLGTIDELPRATLISDRFDVGRSFCTKLWNAARFAFINLGEHSFEPLSIDELESEDRWILSRLQSTIDDVTRQLEQYNPSASVGAAREFFWNELCDWYIELVKDRLKDGIRATKARTVLSFVLDQTFRLFHPFVPFITEALWERLNRQVPVRGVEKPTDGSRMIIGASWPESRAEWRDTKIEADFELLKDVVRAVRDIRAKYGISPRREVNVRIKADSERLNTLKGLEDHLVTQARLATVEIGEDIARASTSAAAMVGDVEIYVDGVLDPGKERARLEKQRRKIEKSLTGAKRKLSNPKFREKAPPDVVRAEEERVSELKKQLKSVLENMKALD